MDLMQRNIYYCKVSQIKPTFVLIDFKNTKGICHISEVSDYLVKDINEYFKVGQSYYFLLMNPLTTDGKYKFSYKQINPHLLK
jgi:predicted RNA-binding protein with RPS1 domain